MTAEIHAVVFDCYGTLVDFGDEAFARAYGEACAQQGVAIDGKTFYDKWMEIWRRLAQAGQSSDTGTAAVGAGATATQISLRLSARPRTYRLTPSITQRPPGATGR